MWVFSTLYATNENFDLDSQFLPCSLPPRGRPAVSLLGWIIRKKEERWGVIQEKCRETLLSGWRFSGVLKKWKWNQLLYEGSKMKGILRSISRVSGCARQYSRNIWRQLKLFLNSFWWQKFCSLELSFVPKLNYMGYGITSLIAPNLITRFTSAGIYLYFIVFSKN